MRNYTLRKWFSAVIELFFRLYGMWHCLVETICHSYPYLLGTKNWINMSRWALLTYCHYCLTSRIFEEEWSDDTFSLKSNNDTFWMHLFLYNFNYSWIFWIPNLTILSSSIEDDFVRNDTIAVKSLLFLKYFSTKKTRCFFV